MKERIYVLSLPQTFGGGEVFLIRLCDLLGIQSNYIVVSPDLPALQSGVEKLGGQFIKLTGLSGVAVRLSFLLWLLRNRRDIRAATTTFIVNGRGAIYFAPLIRFVTGVRPVVICHTELVLRSKNVKDFLYGAALHSACRSIAVSETVEEQHRKRWPRLQLRAIPNWIDNSSFKNAPLSIGEESPSMQIAVVGRLVESKGVLDLATIFAAMSGLEAHFYGEGPLRDALDNIAALKPSIKVHGHVDDIRERLPHHTILVSGSYSESFSYSVAEGITAGLLCVISDIPAHRELLGPEYPEKLFFFPGDKDAFCHALDSAARLLNESNGQYAQEAIIQARSRVIIRNNSNVARASYREVLLGIAPDSTSHEMKVS